MTNSLHVLVGADVWETPQEFFDALHAEFRFDLDVCALPCNAKVQQYFTPEADGLRQPWGGTCWMNPPYGRGIKNWICKAFEESQRGATVVCLVPARTETAWWHDYCQRGEVRFVRGRLWFKRPDGKTGRPRFGSAVVVFRPNDQAQISAERR